MVVINATQGSDSANSYATIDEADSILAGVYGAEEWFSLGDDSKAKLLITATNAIDDMPIKYDKASDTQALAFPLSTELGAPSNGFADAKKAAVYQALFIFQNYDTVNEAVVGKIQGVRQEVLSKIQKTISGYNPLASMHSRTLKLLSKYTDFGFVIRRG